MAVDPMTCDCHLCEYERMYPEHAQEEERMGYNLTCTCTARFARYAEHDSDCELWLIDEFWAGFLTWDIERELLVPTDKYPDHHDSGYVGSAEEYEWDEEDMVEHRRYQDKLQEMSQTDRDIALTTDAFIERMIARNPGDENLTWTKDDEGYWKPNEQEAVNLPGGGSYQQKFTSDYGSTTYHSHGYGYDNDGWSNDWDKYLSDRHTATVINFPDGTKVQGTSLSKSHLRDTPDFGLYLDDGWRPDGMAIMLPWRDYGLPNVSYGFARYAIEEAWSWAKAEAIVEVGCIGGHGRTGTVLACMAVLSEPEFTPEEAIAFVRTAYCHHAVETRDQEWFVAYFHAMKNDLPEPPKPVYVPPKPTVVSTTTGGAATGTPKATVGSQVMALRSDGPLGDPNRKKGAGKARRGKRGGKRNQRHRNRMAQGSRR